MPERTGMLLAAAFVGFLSACTSGPPSNVPELVAQLARDRVLFDQDAVAEIIGSPELRPDSPTRVPGVILAYFESRGRDDQIRQIKFDLKACTRVADFTQRFGKESNWIFIPDGGGRSYAWDRSRRGGNIQVSLSGMQHVDQCAPTLWIIAQPVL